MQCDGSCGKKDVFAEGELKSVIIFKSIPHRYEGEESRGRRFKCWQHILPSCRKEK